MTEHPIQIEHNDRRYPAIYVRENKAFANEPDEIARPKNAKPTSSPILDEMKNGGSEALLGFLLDRDIRDFNAEAIPETAERRQQKLKSAPAWRQDHHRRLRKMRACRALLKIDRGSRERTLTCGFQGIIKPPACSRG